MTVVELRSLNKLIRIARQGKRETLLKFAIEEALLDNVVFDIYLASFCEMLGGGILSLEGRLCFRRPLS